MAIRSVFGNREGRERKPLANRDYYRTLIAGRKEAVFLADPAGDLYLLNGPAEALSGYGSEEIRELHVRDLFLTIRERENPFGPGPLSEFSSYLYLLTASRYLVPVTVAVKEVEGQKFLCTCLVGEQGNGLTSERVNKLAGEQGNGLTSEQVNRGTGERVDKLTGEQVNRLTSERVDGLTEFEHGARNLLGNMIGFGSILSRDPVVAGNKQLSDYAGSILKSGTRLKELFNRFSLGEGEAHEVARSAVPVAPLLQKAMILLDTHAGRHSQPVRLEEAGALYVLSDELLLLEVIRFLLEKAILYSRGEEIVIGAAGEPEGKVTLTVDNVGQDFPQEVVAYIKRENGRESYDLSDPVLDGSPGIRPLLHTLNRIEAKINFTASPSSGEIVSVILPAATADGPEDEMAQLEAAIRQRSPRILVVEDEKVTATILELFLGGISDVSLAYSGNEALNITEILYHKGILFDLVILDIGLPPPWDGVLLKRDMEKRWPSYRDIPFLAQTAFSGKEYRERIAEAGFRVQMIKPLNRRELLMNVKRITGQ
jgi:CheY-like chemotaxis protein